MPFAIGLIQRRRTVFAALLTACVVLVLVLLNPSISESYVRHTNFSQTSNHHQNESRNKHPWTRLVSGVDGFYVFENVYVKDRQLFMVPHPRDPPLPELRRIITSVVHENYTRDPGSYQVTPADRLFQSENDHNGDYPQVPRLRVLESSEEAKKVIPGWGDLERYVTEDGNSWVGTPRQGGWLDSFTSHKVQEPAVQVFDGVNWYLADDPAITGWGSLMHHYFHWMGEDLLGSWKAYVNSVYAPTTLPLNFEIPESTSHSTEDESIEAVTEEVEEALALPAEDDSDVPQRRNAFRSPLVKRGWPFSSGYKFNERDLEIRRQYIDMPKRVISPWCTNWEGRELNEMVLFKAFRNPKAYRRDQWRQLSQDRQWRMFDRVVITDRHAAHNNKSSQTEIWNKMALGILHEPLPADIPHWFTAPQDSLTTALSLPSIPLERSASSGGKTHRSLAEDFVKIVYVDRQNSDRKFDNASHDGLMEVLEDMHEHGAKWKERDSRGKKKEIKIKVKVDVVKFEHLRAKEQIQAIYDADVILGVHGNGLTHIVWAKPGATVIEAFPVGTFIRDYELLSFALNHEYYAVWADRVYTKDEWIHNHGNIEAGKLHDGTEIQLDSAFIKSLIKKAVKSMR